MIRKEIWHGMRAYKATFFIKGYRQRAVACSHLQYRKLSAVFFNKKFNQRFGIAFSLKWGNCSDILNFKYSIPFVRYDTLALHSVIIKNIHFTIIEITANHIFLLIRQQEQIKILFFVFCNFYNSHQSHLQIPIRLPGFQYIICQPRYQETVLTGSKNSHVPQHMGVSITHILVARNVSAITSSFPPPAG